MAETQFTFCLRQKHHGDTETDRVRVKKKEKRKTEREGGRRCKEDKEDFVESQEVEGRAWKERGRLGWENVGESKYK